MSTTARALKAYRTRRDFTRTGEPSGKESRRSSKQLEFVVQKHAASHLHFDLRLESDGVMKSWAVPKGPSLDPRDKRLAMQVEDHPIEYNSFEGTIPKGEYGGGTVMIWDRGTYEPIDDTRKSLTAGLRAGKLEFTLHGEKLRGAFALVRMARGDGREWLLIKHSDEFASKRRVTGDRDRSVVSQRTMSQIAVAKDSSQIAVAKDSASVSNGMPDDVTVALSEIEHGRGDGDITVESATLHVTNLSKVYFRKARKTKGDVLRYYARMGDLLLPHLMDRPLVLRRYPDGIDQPAFFQQRASDDTPDGIRTEMVAVADKSKESRIVGGDLVTLLYCAQLGGIDMNPWHSRVESLGDADYSILDLDPGPRAPFSRVVEVAHVVHDVLDAFGLHAAVKTSGASGLHIVVPLPSGTSYQSSLLLAQVVATETASAAPKHVTVVRKVRARGPGQVYVDYLQNVQGKSVASVLSLRAQPLASVSMPVTWEELDHDLDPGDFTIDVPVSEAAARMREYSEILAHPVDLSVFADVV